MQCLCVSESQEAPHVPTRSKPCAEMRTMSISQHIMYTTHVLNVHLVGTWQQNLSTRRRTVSSPCPTTTSFSSIFHCILPWSRSQSTSFRRSFCTCNLQHGFGAVCAFEALQASVGGSQCFKCKLFEHVAVDTRAIYMIDQRSMKTSSCPGCTRHTVLMTAADIGFGQPMEMA